MRPKRKRSRRRGVDERVPDDLGYWHLPRFNSNRVPCLSHIPWWKNRFGRACLGYCNCRFHPLVSNCSCFHLTLVTIKEAKLMRLAYDAGISSGLSQDICDDRKNVWRPTQELISLFLIFPVFPSEVFKYLVDDELRHSHPLQFEVLAQICDHGSGEWYFFDSPTQKNP